MATLGMLIPGMLAARGHAVTVVSPRRTRPGVRGWAMERAVPRIGSVR